MSRDLFETDSPDYSADRLYDYADAIKERNREALLSHDRVAEQGPEESETRYPCPEGCGAEFLTVEERETHFIIEHDEDAA